MNSQEQLQLESERSFLEQQLDALPETAVLTRSSTLSRIRTINRLLADERRVSPPLKAVLTFRGRPVVGSHGVLADFASRATTAFADAVVTVAASLHGPLASTGPVPNRDQCQLLITNIAVGSFGFEFEEHRPDQLPFEDNTPASHALKLTCALLEQSAEGSDDELSECISEVSRRAIDAIRRFVEVLGANDALCTLEVGQQRFRFLDAGQVQRSLERLSHDNVQETQVKLQGEFQGVLPKGRTFEFKLASTDEVVRGTVGREVDDPGTINQHLHEPVEITVLETRVGTGRPRYQLLGIPDWRTE